MKTFDKVYKFVSKIPKGKVATYKQVSDATKINNPKIVGFALHVNKDPVKVPCHRVIKSNGFLAEGYAMGGKSTQMKRLKSEGVKFSRNGKVDFKNFLFEY